MTVVAVTSAGGAPGATSTAVGLAIAASGVSSSPALLVEADPNGGVLAARFSGKAEPSLLNYVTEARHGFVMDRIDANTQELGGAIRTLVGPPDPSVARRLVRESGMSLFDGLAESGRPTVFDIGRLDDVSPSAALAARADKTLLTLRPEFDQVQAGLFRVGQLRRLGADVGLVVIGDEPLAPTEIADAMETPLAAAIPSDALTARALNGGRYEPKRFLRSQLWRALSSLAWTLFEPAATEDTVPEITNA